MARKTEKESSVLWADTVECLLKIPAGFQKIVVVEMKDHMIQWKDIHIRTLLNQDVFETLFYCTRRKKEMSEKRRAI